MQRLEGERLWQRNGLGSGEGEEGEGEEQLGTSWGAQKEQVRRWNNGSEDGGTVSGEAEMRRLGRRRRVAALVQDQSRQPGEEWLYLSVPTPTSRP